MPESVIQSTTQQFLDIYDVSNDVVVLKNGAASVILTVNAINFGLLAEEEQDAVMYQYAALLNSLNFPIQIVIRSQTKDASSYLQLLKDREDGTADRVKREWIRRYREFIGNLIYERNVLDKKFYVSIPASYLEMGLVTAQNVISSFKNPSIEGVEKSVILEKALTILEPRRDHLISQFARIGLVARQLKTQEIIQLFYTSYNPEATEGQQITDTRSYTTPLVQAQIRGVLMNDQTTTPSVGQPTTDQQLSGTTPPTPTTGLTNPAPVTPAPAPAESTSVSTNPPTPAPTMTPEPVAPISSPAPAATTMPQPSASSPSMSSQITSPAMPLPTPTSPTISTPTNVPSSPNPLAESPITTPPTASNLPTPTMTAPAPVATNPITPPDSAPGTPAPTSAPATPTTPVAPITPVASATTGSVPTTPATTAKPDPELQAVIDSTLKELNTTPPAEEELATPDLAGVEPVVQNQDKSS